MKGENAGAFVSIKKKHMKKTGNDNRLSFYEKVKKLPKRVVYRGYKLLTVKVLFPMQYKKHIRKPINEKKVLFVEPRFMEISSSLKLIEDEFRLTGDYEIKEIFLGNELLRVRQQYRNIMYFLKEMATAKYVFTTDSNSALGGFEKRAETIVVQAWHACGAFKKFGFSTAELLFGGNRKQQLRYPLHRNYDIVTVSSPEITWAYEEAMGIENKNIVKPLGVSRTDVFFDKKYIGEAQSEVYAKIIMARNKKIILYAPTFRGRVALAEAPDKLDIEKMKESLGREYILLIKHHPFIKERPEVPKSCRDFAFDVTELLTIEELICTADICISDYSSLIFEYSIFEKPMIFFSYDLEEYFDWRGFYYKYDELTPGPVLNTTDEIIDHILNLEDVFDKNEIIAFKNRFMGACDGHATEKIIEEALKLGGAL